MTFTIKYHKTGKEIEIDDIRAYMMLDCKELDPLGFKTADIHQKR